MIRSKLNERDNINNSPILMCNPLTLDDKTLRVGHRMQIRFNVTLSFVQNTLKDKGIITTRAFTHLLQVIFLFHKSYVPSHKKKEGIARGSNIIQEIICLLQFYLTMHHKFSIVNLRTHLDIFLCSYSFL